jgi:alkylation response protein AidB-like acyl-CoA dehydrogenase
VHFAVSTEQRDFTRSISEMLAKADVPHASRQWAAGHHDAGVALWRRLAELGVSALAVPEEHGGFGADAVDLVIAFETLGYHCVPGPIVESFAAIPALLADPGAARLAGHWLPRLAAGKVVGTLALPPHVPYPLDADIAELRLLLDGDELYEFESRAARSSIDPARRLADIDTSATTRVATCASTADAAFNHGALATAAQVLGIGQRLLDDSVVYATHRVQYGKPIGGYQAIKHLLADVATGIELARPLVHGAAVAIAGAKNTIVRDVSAAKVAATDAGYRAARTALQVHGAIGYTAEHDLGLALLKARALHTAWGTQRHHRGRVLAALTATRDRPVESTARKAG